MPDTGGIARQWNLGRSDTPPPSRTYLTTRPTVVGKMRSSAALCRYIRRMTRDRTQVFHLHLDVALPFERRENNHHHAPGFSFLVLARLTPSFQATSCPTPLPRHHSYLTFWPQSPERCPPPDQMSTEARPCQALCSHDFVDLLTPVEAHHRKHAHESRNAPEPIQILDLLSRNHYVHTYIQCQ